MCGDLVMTPLQTTWGWLLVWDFFLAGTGAGAYLSGVIAEFLGEKNRVAGKIGVFLSAPLVLLGVVFLMLDLGRPDHFMFVFSNPSSLITIGSAFITAFLIVSVIHIGLWIWPFKLLEKAIVVRRVLGLVGAVLALGVMTYPGFAFGVVNAIPFWNSGMLPLLFPASAISTGMAAVLIGLAVYHGRSVDLAQENILGSIRTFGKWLGAVLGLELVVLFFYLAVGSTVTPPASEATQLIISGSLAPLFWGGVVAVGLLIPLLLQVWNIFRAKAVSAAMLALMAAFSGILVVTGGLALRFTVLSAGISVAPPYYTEGKEPFLTVSNYPPQWFAGLIPTYTPSAFDYATVAGLFIILAAIYFVAARIIPTSKLTAAKKA